MSNEINRGQESFKILLTQLQITDSEQVSTFDQAEIRKVTVNKEKGSWHFLFYFQQIVSAEMWTFFTNQLVVSFADIAEVDFNVEIADFAADGETILAYWPMVALRLTEKSPGVQQILLANTPVFEEGTLKITVQSDTEVTKIKNSYLEPIQDYFKKIGLTGFGIQICLDHNHQEQQLQIFHEEKKREDAEIAQQTLLSMQEDAQGKKSSPVDDGPLRIGRLINDADIRRIEELTENDKRSAIEGYVFQAEMRQLRSGKSMLMFKITDYTDSLQIKMFPKDQDDEAMFSRIKVGKWLKVQGNPQIDTFNQFNPELIMMANDVCEGKPEVRQDCAPEDEKRVELHLHTQMSQMDAITPISDYVARAKLWGHQAIAITDHGGVQGFPEAYAAGKKHDMKIIYGIEAYLVDDGVPIAFNSENRPLCESTYVIFDVETTGLSAVYNTIIEMGAVKIRDGEIVDRFSKFANPHHPLSALTIELTGITDEMVQNAPEVNEVIEEFKIWVGDDILVAHNASFDMGFLNMVYQNLGYPKATNPVIDTLELARFLYPDFKRYGLGGLAKKLSVELTQHHRAIYDAEATGNILLVMLQELKKHKIENLEQLNDHIGQGKGYRNARPKHCTILVKNAVGLKNLFKLVSFAHTEYFFRVPRIPRSVLTEYREGLIIGSSCDKGEVYEALIQKPLSEVYPIAEFYDYLEIHPKEVYFPLIEAESVHSVQSLEGITKNLIKIGEELDKLVVATGNTHYLDDKDNIFRQILIRSQGGANPMNRYQLPKVHFRTTDEMLESFAFLGEEKAKELVVTNTNKIADLIEVVKPIKDELYVPKIEGADEEIRALSYTRAHEIYGEKIPDIVHERIEKELESIIGHGFAVIYLISQKLVKKSLDDGYLVGSRGSVGSSLVAHLTEITEVNPMPPHYVCPSCCHAEFFTDGSVSSGYDLPDKKCSECDATYRKDGQDIPFETFLGFKMDKVPDIDLNFSGDYQNVAHDYTKELFGEEYVYRAGTIATVADKTAYGYVRGFLQENNLTKKTVEIDRLSLGTTGTKRTTGQHPGGIIVIPDYMDVYDFTPIQFPADNMDSRWKTTHFDFHSIHDNVLKLDILGHDDPTVIRMLQDLSGIDPKDIPVDDPDVMRIFSGPEPLGVTAEQINCKTGTFGVPEFGTQFVRQMLEATKPSKFSELVQISGLSHGTDVWLKNAQELIDKNICKLNEVIGCRDDIMVYLIYQGVESSFAFKIMESVRKGKGLTPEMESEMREHKVPNWYIESCKKIKYMFPKAHAAAYVLMAVRIAYFKVHMPLYFYATYFTVRANDFDIDIMSKGALTIKAKLDEIAQKGMEASVKDRNLQTVLELAYEMCQRGFTMKKIDLYKSSAKEFIIEGESLIPPFISIAGLGENVAEQIVRARDAGEFLSKEDLQQRGKVSKTIIEFMDNHGCLTDLPDENQLSFF